MTLRWGGIFLCLALMAPSSAPSSALAQDEAEPIPSLPEPTLTDPEELPPAPDPDAPRENEGSPEVLLHIGLGDHPDWEAESEAGAPNRDVGFTVPDDARVTSPGGLEGAALEHGPPTFSIAAGAGYARLLSTVPVDFFRIDQRFLIRIPDFPALRLGVGVSEMVDGQGRFLLSAGARIGFGTFLHEDRTIRIEGVATVQPGVIAGFLGAQFDLHADIDLRLVIEQVVQIIATGGFSLVGTTSLLGVTGSIGFVF